MRCVQTFTDVREGRRKQTSWKAIYLYFIGAAASAHKIDAAIEKGCTSDLWANAVYHSRCVVCRDGACD